MASAIRTAREERDFQSYVDALLSTGDSDQVLEALLDLEVPTPYRARAKVLYAPNSPAAVFRKLEAKGRIRSLSRSADSYAYATTVGRKAPIQVHVPFVVASLRGGEDISRRVQVAIAICTSQQWQALRRLIKANYPKLVPILLSQTELINSAKQLRQVSGHEVRVRGSSAREGPRKSVRQWTYEQLDEALRSIKERRQTLTWLEVEFFPRLGQHSHVIPKATCKIRKSGEIEVAGSLRLAFEAIVKEVARVGERKLRHFSQRGLREADYQPRPLAINFSQPIFEDLDTVRGLVGLLAKYPHSMHAVEHGNPYAHVKVTDLHDFSAFEVWAIPPRRIALLPGLKASEAAFERLVHFIFDGFREGQVGDYERAERGATST